jgi:3-oxoacyl-[acyl-carrier protein] reductase
MARESSSPKRKCDGSDKRLLAKPGRRGGQFAGGRNEAFNEGSTIMTNLFGKTALVTGASRGIGRASALALGKAGAQVLVHYGRAASEADAAVNQIRSDGGRAHAIAADLSMADGPKKLAFDVGRIVEDRLDVLVASAGISKLALIEEMTIQDFDSLFAVNVRAPYFLVHQLLPSLGAGSSVVFLSSAATHAAVSNLSAYAATKGAVETLVRHFAFILGQYGIRVNAVAPGMVETDMSIVKTDAGRQFALSIQALKRIAQPDDIADVVTFLASNDARWITGHTLSADGGTRL